MSTPNVFSSQFRKSLESALQKQGLVFPKSLIDLVVLKSTQNCELTLLEYRNLHLQQSKVAARKERDMIRSLIQEGRQSYMSSAEILNKIEVYLGYYLKPIHGKTNH